MKARSAKAKGTRLEKEIAQDLRDADLDKQARRMPLSGAMEGFKSDIFTSLPMQFELKNQETWKPLEYYEQACESAHGRIPVVVMAKNRTPPYAFLSWSDFLYIMKFAKDGGWLGDLPFSKKKIK